MGFSNIGLSGLLLILLMVLVIWGPKKLPEIGRGFGKSLHEFRKATSGLAGSQDELPPAVRDVDSVPNDDPDDLANE